MYFKEAIKEGVVQFAEARKKAISKLKKFEVHDEDGERFIANIEKLDKELPDEGYLLSFSHEIPMFLLRQKLEQIEWNRNVYKSRIKEKRDGLHELLNLEHEKSGKEITGKGFEFAEQMIAFNKIRDMVPQLGSSTMTEDREQRIKNIIDLLDSVLDQKENHAHLVVNKELKNEYRWKDIFTSSKVSYTTLSEAFDRVQEIFDKNIAAFTEVLVTMRKADLELAGKYDVDIHDDYFEHFKWFKLEQEELNIFPPVLLVTHSNDLLNEGMSQFAKLMVTNKPIKVVAVIDRTVNPTNPDIDWEDASLSFRQELAANALSHRNVFTLQCATDRPEGLLNGLRAGISSIAPALMHVLVPTKGEDPLISFLKINAAAAGRYFPYLMYDPHKATEWGGRFDMMDNSQPEKDWPIYAFTHTSPDNKEITSDLAFTYADYKAMTQEKVEELFLVPESMANEYLIPLDDYLDLSQNEQTGKVPFIWLIDEENVMVRAALPYMWVASCQERLDFWNFIQELGGQNNYHVKTSLALAKKEWESAKNLEIDQLLKKHNDELTKVQRDAAGVAMDKLASILLNLDSIASVPKTASPTSEPKESAVSTPADEAVPVEEAPEPEPEPLGEAWIETFRCTSCNDCTDQFPAIFAYNEEKQAYVKDAGKGTFEQIVMAAESCPASCIHPGAPLNPDEPNLVELIERAAKFN